MRLLREVTFDNADIEIDVESAARILGVEPSTIDESYGVVGVDLANGLYAVIVEIDDDGEVTEGTYSNPPIVTWGPPNR